MCVHGYRVAARSIQRPVLLGLALMLLVLVVTSRQIGDGVRGWIKRLAILDVALIVLCASVTPGGWLVIEIVGGSVRIDRPGTQHDVTVSLETLDSVGVTRSQNKQRPSWKLSLDFDGRVQETHFASAFEAAKAAHALAQRSGRDISWYDWHPGNPITEAEAMKCFPRGPLARFVPRREALPFDCVTDGGESVTH